MTLGEGALGAAGELLQQAREQIVAAGNAGWGPDERAAAAVSLRALRDQLLGVANRQDGAGGYVFGGQGSAQPPFLDTPGGVTWVGTTGTQQTASDEPMPVTLDGQAAWLSAASGNGVFETSVTTANGSAWIDAGRVVDPGALTGSSYALSFSVAGGTTTFTITRDGNPTTMTGVPFTSGQAIEIDGMAFTVTGEPANGDAFAVAPSTTSMSAFEAIDRTLAMLEDPAAGAAEVTQAVKFGLRDLDAVMASMNAHRAEAGSWLQRLDMAEGRIADAKLSAQVERSLAEDLDMAQAVSEFQLKQTGYDAALRSYSMVQRMSLFNYIGS
jgi:flagellar hook-associated protein 3 FlgL